MQLKYGAKRQIFNTKANWAQSKKKKNQRGANEGKQINTENSEHSADVIMRAIVKFCAVKRQTLICGNDGDSNSSESGAEC